MKQYDHDELMHMVMQKGHIGAGTKVSCIVARDKRYLHKQPELLVLMGALNARAEFLTVAGPLLYHNNTAIIQGLQNVINILEMVDEAMKKETGQRSPIVQQLAGVLSDMENACMTVQRCVLQGCERVSKEMGNEKLDGS